MARITDKLVKSIKVKVSADGAEISWSSDERGVTCAKPILHRYAIIWDDAVPGFGVRVTTNGIKAFILNYRARGRERRITIGRYPTWSASTARGEAMALRRRVDRGEDPLGQRREAREAPTVSGLFRAFSEYHLPVKRPSTAEAYTHAFKAYILPRLGKYKVKDVKHADVAALHRSLKATPNTANRVVAVLSKAMNMAVRDGWREDNPCRGVERYEERRRQRFLSQDEIARLSDALAAYQNKTVANALRFLLLTGARRGEVLAADWQQFDMENWVWIKPSAHTKTKREHRVPLSAAAISVLKEQALATGGKGYVFPGRLEGQALRELKRAWRVVTKAAGIGEFVPSASGYGKVWKPSARIHDLRHTHASILASAGSSLAVIGAMLGHTQPGTTARYAHFYDEPLREAAEAVGRAVSPKP